MHEEHPELLKDQYWEEVVPKDLPYTVASEHYRRHEPPCSADHYKVKAEEAVYANLQSHRKSHDETYADYVSNKNHLSKIHINDILTLPRYDIYPCKYAYNDFLRIIIHFRTTLVTK